jgi:hypothetical protein
VNYKQALTAAPPTPDCFQDREQWAAYLASAQQDKSVSRQPFKGSTYNPSFNFCDDCTLKHSTSMAHAGKCNPSVFRVVQAPQKSHEQAV